MLAEAPGRGVCNARFERWFAYVTRDGERFLMNVPAGGESAAAGPSLTIVTNWQAGLKK